MCVIDYVCYLLHVCYALLHVRCCMLLLCYDLLHMLLLNATRYCISLHMDYCYKCYGLLLDVLWLGTRVIACCQMLCYDYHHVMTYVYTCVMACYMCAISYLSSLLWFIVKKCAIMA